MKISDFGTSREWNERSTKMSFAGTVAWMAPEVIKNEPCSEKVDVWSYGIVLWELLTCEIPYRDLESSAIIWGVGNHNMELPCPSSFPSGLTLLIKQCWSVRPRNRPSFPIILNHLEIAAIELLRLSDADYFKAQQDWRKEVQTKMPTVGKNPRRLEQDLIKKRQEELRHAKDIRLAYERKLELTNNMCVEVNVLLKQLLQREQEMAQREKIVQQQPGFVKNHRKFASSIKKAQDRIYRKYMTDKLQQNPVHEPDPAQVYSQLDGQNRPKSVVVPASASVTGPGCASKAKKLRHRVSSGPTGCSPKASPGRERRYQSEPRVQLVDSETQTEEAEPAFLRPGDGVGERGASETVESRDGCSSPDLAMVDDQMASSNEQLELRESSDEDHLENLGRQVSLCRELSERFSVKRAYVTETRNGEVTVLRCGGERRASSEGEESWTDEEGESQSDSNYSLRRKR